MNNYNPCMNCNAPTMFDDFCFDCQVILHDDTKNFEEHYKDTKLDVADIGVDARTKLVEKEIKNTTETIHINYEYIHHLIELGIDPWYTDAKGYTLNELAGMRGRYDIAELIYRSTYMENI